MDVSRSLHYFFASSKLSFSVTGGSELLIKSIKTVLYVEESVVCVGKRAEARALRHPGHAIVATFYFVTQKRKPLCDNHDFE